MNGDFSTLRFDKKKRFAKVMHQQGRVMTDADLNEASAIAAYFDETERIDVIGHSGTPAHDAAFGIVKPDGTPASGVPWAQLCFTSGRYYIEGKMVELFPGAAGALNRVSQEIAAQPPAGKYWVVLQAYERYVSPTEDPDVIEEALRGPDTAGRTRVEWHVQLVPAGSSTHCDDLTAYNPRTSFGTLSASAPAATTSSDPCETPNIGGYQGLENQLYRVEVHKGTGEAGGPSLKWSRENACLLSQISQVDSLQKSVEVSQPGRDSKTGFQAAKFVEAMSAADLHDATSGEIAEVLTVTDEREIEINATTGQWTTFTTKAVPNNYLRGWHGYITGVTAGTSIPIDGKGLTITIGAGDLVRGDYWLIPARAISGNVLWPEQGGVKLQLPPFGTGRSHAVLGLIERVGANWTMLTDCRHIFYPLTEQERFVYVSGDGQEAMPEFPILGDLIVGVVNGPMPVANAKIQWSIASGALDIGLQENQTGPDGMARLRVRKIQSERLVLKAELLGSDGHPVQTPIFFNLNQSKASKVSYAPLAGCSTLTGKTTVQDALDRLASIRRMYLVGGDTQVAQRDPASVTTYLPLPDLLRVRVTSLCGPVANATVTFDVTKNGAVGTLPEIAPEGSSAWATTVTVQTNADGIARCRWRPTFGETDPQKVRATFASDGFSGPEAIFFDFQSLEARDIGYSPGCSLLLDKNTITVQQALDELCANIGQGGGCEITVGEGGKYPDIATAVKAIIEQKLRNVTICLMPGKKQHQVTEEIRIEKIPELYLEIHGGGLHMPLLVSKGGLLVNGIGGFTLRNLNIALTDEVSRIEINGCEKAEIDHCTISRVSFKQSVPIATILQNQTVRLTSSTFDARYLVWNLFLKTLERIPPKYSVLWAREIMTESIADNQKRLTPFFQMKGDALINAEKALEEAFDKMKVKESAFVEPITLWQRAMGQVHNVSTAEMPARIKSFRSAMNRIFTLLDEVSGLGVLLDHTSDCWIESCDFTCLVSFTGLPVKDEDLWSKFLGVVGLREISVVGNGKVITLTNNLFDKIVFGRTIEEWTSAPHQAGESFSASESLKIHANTFRQNTNQWISFVAHLSDNQFQSTQKVAAQLVATKCLPVANVGFEGPIVARTDTNLKKYEPINEIGLTKI